MKNIYSFVMATTAIFQFTYAQVDSNIPTIQNMLSSKTPVDTKILKRMAKYDSGKTDVRTNNLIKTKFFQAQQYYDSNLYDKALNKIDEIEVLTGSTLMIESQDLKVKCLIGAERFEEANVELYLLQGLGLTDEQLQQAAINASLIESKIEEKKDREAAAAKEAEIQRQDEAKWKNTLDLNTILAYQKYLQNEDFKLHTDEAIVAIDRLEWEELLLNKNLEGFKKYSVSGKNVSNKEEAKKYIEYWTETEVDFSDVEDKSKIDNLGYYIQALEIDISGNELVKLPDNIGNLEFLKNLNSSKNNLSVLPESIIECTSLEELDLEKNILKELPKNIRALKNLKRLKLGKNNLKELPSKFGKLTNLEDLYLDKNSLEELPDSFSELKKLKRLDLSNNKLFTLPDEFGYLSNLKVLRLVNTGINSFPLSFGNLNLDILYADKETLKKAKDVLKAIKKRNKDFKVEEVKTK